MDVKTNFTAGGVNKFETYKLNPYNIAEVSLNKDRDGWYGWMGSGGSVM